MIDRYSYKTLTWLDVLNPTSEEVRELVDECSVPLEFTHDLTSPTPRTEVVAKKGVLKITLDWPIVKRTDISHPHEIKMIVTKNNLITIRFEDIEAIHRFGKEFEVMCMLGNGKKTSGTSGIKSVQLFFTLLNHLYNTLYFKLDYINTQIDEIETGVFSDREKEMVFEISTLGRKVIAFRQTIGAHEKALEQLRENMKVAFSGKHEPAIDALDHHYRHVTRTISAVIATIEDLRDTNSALLTTKQNEVMKIFTILAFITFPLTLFTSMFGMNTVTTPIVGQEGDFWLILGIMGIVSISFFAFFKYKKWI